MVAKPLMSKVISPVWNNIIGSVTATPVEDSQKALYWAWHELIKPVKQKHEPEWHIPLQQHNAPRIKAEVVYEASGEAKNTDNPTLKKLLSDGLIDRASSNGYHNDPDLIIKNQMVYDLLTRTIAPRLLGLLMFLWYWRRLRKVSGKIDLHNLQHLLNTKLHRMLCLLVFLQFIKAGNLSISDRDPGSFNFTPDNKSKKIRKRFLQYLGNNHR